MGCNASIAQSTLNTRADYLLAVKDNQPLHADMKSCFETVPADEVEQVETIGNNRGRLEARMHTVSHAIDWYAAQRSYPGAPLPSTRHHCRGRKPHRAWRPNRNRAAI